MNGHSSGSSVAGDGKCVACSMQRANHIVGTSLEVARTEEEEMRAERAKNFWALFVFG